MTKMKKMLLCIILCIMLPALAIANDIAPIFCAAQRLVFNQFSHYSAASCDESTGIWRVHGYTADALLDQLWEYGENNTQTLAAFHLELEGNLHTGVLNPIFRFYYVDGKKPIQATAVSFLIDGVRYDLAAASTGTITYGKETAEIISAPLTQNALEIIPALLNGQYISVRLLGNQIHTIDLTETIPTPKRTAIQRASLAAVKTDISLLQDADIWNYALWDLSNAAWETAHGFCPSYAVHKVSDTLCQEIISDPFGMLLPGSEGKVARAAQELLIRHGFYVGTASNIFDKNASSAVSRAQKFYGLIVTGCMDSQLENALLTQPIPTAAPNPPVLQRLGHDAVLSLDRYWFANGVSAARGNALHAVSNSNNTLLIADGLIQNISNNVMHLFMQLDAQVIYGDVYAYKATVLCQNNHETRLDTSLLPLEEARLIVYAEIPDHLTEVPADQWRIQFSIGGDTLEYRLK